MGKGGGGEIGVVVSGRVFNLIFLEEWQYLEIDMDASQYQDTC